MFASICLIGILILLLTGRNLLTLSPKWSLNLDPASLTSWMLSIKAQPWAPPLILASFVVSSLIFVPIFALVFAVALTFPPLEALALAIGGTFLAALTTYGVGRGFGSASRKFIARPQVRACARRLASGGIWPVIALRLTPVAPFAAAGLISGSLKLPLKSFALGSFLGLLPGIITVTFISRAGGASLWEGNWPMVLLVVCLGASVLFLIRRLGRGLSGASALPQANAGHSSPPESTSLAVAVCVLFSAAAPPAFAVVKAPAPKSTTKPMPESALDEPRTSAPVNPAAPAEESKTTKLLPTASPGFAASPEAALFETVCGNVRMINPKPFAFTDMEIRLLCGDGEKSQVGVPWSRIPPNEAAYFMRGFMQNRGYHQPDFVQDGDLLFVDTGPESRLKRFRIVNGPEHWDPPFRRLVNGTLLTPALLDDLQAWAVSQIKDEGYACASVSIRADPDTGEALARLEPGDIKHIKSVETTGDTGLTQGALDRYSAFRVGDIYRERLVSLTKRRILADGFLQTLAVATRCESDGAVIARDVILGPSRRVSIGVGGSTELGARIKAIVRQSRVDDAASSIQATLNASYLNEHANIQSIEGKYVWYYSNSEPRRYVQPNFEVSHEAAPTAENQKEQSQVLHGWNQEYARGQVDFLVGPTLLANSKSRGFGPEHTSIAFAEARIKWTQHDYEFFFNSSPRTGEQVELTADAITSGLLADFTAQRLRIQGEKLWEILRFDPPLFILGLRFDANSIFSGDPNIVGSLPPQLLTRLGGDRDLRGFERASLPRSQVPALSGVSAGLEGRFHKVLFKRADIFSFLDAGMLGIANFHLRDPIFMSPGLGLRWESPIGVLRTFAARRFALNEVATEPTYGADWRIGFTFGEEF